MSEFSGNVLTLEEEPVFTAKQIPQVPKATYLYAKGGEKTFALDKGCKFADGKPIIIHERVAEEGEILRDINFKYRLDVAENIAFRFEARTRATENESNMMGQMALCRSSIVYFINTYCWTFVPGEEAVPFILYDFQEDLATWMLWLIKMELNGLVEKSRCQGLSWLCCCLHAYVLLFYPNKVNYFLSLGKTEVDDRTMDSLFGKQRFLFNHFPEWMKGGWEEKVDDIDNIMKMNIPTTKSLLKGLLTGSTAGRSGRGTLAVYDEFAHVETAMETLEAGTSLTRCALYVSTVKGRDNAFAILAHKESMPKKSIHWRMNPILNEEWAVKERSEIVTQEVWDQEMEIAYETSTSGRVFPQLVSFTSDATDWSHLVSGPEWQYDPAYTVHIGMDYGISDPNTVVYAQVRPTHPGFPNKHKSCLVIFDEDSHRDQPFDELVPMVQEKPYRYETYVGDLYTADKRENIRGEVYKDFFRKQGMEIVGKRNSVIAPIEELKGLLEIPGAIAINKDKCPALVKALQNWAYPTDKEGLPLPGSKPQVRSQHSHYCKAICYLVDYMYGQKIPKKKLPFSWSFKLTKRAAI